MVFVDCFSLLIPIYVLIDSYAVHIHPFCLNNLMCKTYIYKEDWASGDFVTCISELLRIFPAGSNARWENTKRFFQNLRRNTETYIAITEVQ